MLLIEILIIIHTHIYSSIYQFLSIFVLQSCNMPSIVSFPPFPENVPTHPLLVLDYQLLKAGEQAEIDKLWKAATELGFW